MPLLLSVALLAPVAVTHSITFDEALGWAEHAPLVQGARQALRSQSDLTRRVSRLTHNPQLSVQPGMRLAPAGAREPELLVELSQAWSLSGHDGARRRSLEAEQAVLGAETRAASLAQRLGAARSWIELWVAQRVLAEAQREQALAGTLTKLVDRAASLSGASGADAADARAYIAEARLLVLAAHGELVNRAATLHREAGRALADGALAARGELPAAPVPSKSAQRLMLGRLAALPEVQLRALRARAERLRATEERSARGWVLQLGLMAQRDAPGGFLLSGGLRVTVPLFDRGERESAPLVAQAERQAGEGHDALVRARADLAEAMHEVTHTEEVLAELRDNLVPASREGATLRERIFRAGEATVLEVLQSRRAAVAAVGRLERARGAHAWARVKLWLLSTTLLRQPTAGRP